MLVLVIKCACVPRVCCVQKKWVDLVSSYFQIHPLFISAATRRENGVVLPGTNALHGACPGTYSFTRKL